MCKQAPALCFSATSPELLHIVCALQTSDCSVYEAFLLQLAKPCPLLSTVTSIGLLSLPLRSRCLASGSVCSAMRLQVTNGEVRTTARVINSQLGLTEPLRPLPNNAGVLPANFPATKTASAQLTGPQAAALLVFYGRPVPGPAAQNRADLANYLGYTM